MIRLEALKHMCSCNGIDASDLKLLAGEDQSYDEMLAILKYIRVTTPYALEKAQLSAGIQPRYIMQRSNTEMTSAKLNNIKRSTYSADAYIAMQIDREYTFYTTLCRTFWFRYLADMQLPVYLYEILEDEIKLAALHKLCRTSHALYNLGKEIGLSGIIERISALSSPSPGWVYSKIGRQTKDISRLVGCANSNMMSNYTKIDLPDCDRFVTNHSRELNELWDRVMSYQAFGIINDKLMRGDDELEYI